MKCSYCGKPIVLNPSAEERAKKDVTGKTAAYYVSLFTIHAQCQVDKREAATLELIRRSNHG